MKRIIASVGFVALISLASVAAVVARKGRIFSINDVFRSSCR